MNRFLHIYIVAWSTLYINANLIAYDCSPNSTRIETGFPEFESRACADPSERINAVREDVTILHYNANDLVRVRQCMIKTTTLKTGCGKSSHMFALKDGHTTTIKKISRKECDEMHNKKAVTIDKKSFKLRINDTTYFNYIKGGSVDKDGNCKGSSIHQIILEITVREIWLEADILTDFIHFPNGVKRRYSTSSYYDPVYGYSFWLQIKDRYCLEYRYSILYEGTALSYHSKTLNEQVYYHSSEDVDFAIPVTKYSYSVCADIRFLRTIYDNLLIVTNKKELKYLRAEKNFRAAEFTAAKAVVDVDILNEKLKSQQCQLEMHVRQMSHALASNNSDEFAYFKMRALGFTSDKFAGQILIKKCREVEVEARATEQCYEHIPIAYNGTDVYMTARTHVIRSTAKVIDCRLNATLKATE